MSDYVLALASGPALVLGLAMQGPAGSLASPTGTGFAHVTAGAIDGAARAVNLASADVTGQLPVADIAPGTNGYILTTVGGVSAWAAAPSSGITQLTGDVTAGPGAGSQAATVVRVNGATVPAAAGALTTGNVLQVSGASALSYGPLNLALAATVGSSVLPSANQAAQTMAGDVTGTTAASVVVGARNGAYAFTSAGLTTYAVGCVSPGFAQASTTASSGYPFTITPQASTNSNGTSGNAVIALTAPTGTGTEAGLVITRNGTQCATLGPFLSGGASQSALWLNAGYTPTTSNYTVRVNGTTSQLNGASAVGLMIAGSYAAYVDGTGVVVERNLYVGPDPGVYAGGVGVLGMSNAATNPSTNPSGGIVLFANSGGYVGKASTGELYQIFPASSGTLGTQAQAFPSYLKYFTGVAAGTACTFVIPCGGTATYGTSFVIEATCVFRVKAAGTGSSLGDSTSRKIRALFYTNGGSTSCTQLGTTTSVDGTNLSSSTLSTSTAAFSGGSNSITVTFTPIVGGTGSGTFDGEIYATVLAV